MADKFAIITGASSGIGYALAKLAAADGYDLLVAADRASIVSAASEIRKGSVEIEALEVDLSTIEGVDKLLAATKGRRVDMLCANAGHGLGHGFLEQSVEDWRHVVDTNIVGTIYLLQKVLKEMVARDAGKVLVTGSIAGFMPGAFQAVYNGTKAFVDSFTDAIRNELKESKGVTITTLMPGATETEFFHRAGMDDTKVGSQKKDDAAKVAKDGYDALMSGQASIVSGIHNKLQAAAAHVMPSGILAELHRGMAEPGTAKK